MLSNGPVNGSNGARPFGSIFGEIPGQVFDPIARRMFSIQGLEHSVPTRIQLENSPVGAQCRELLQQLRSGAGTDPASIVSGFLKTYANRDYQKSQGDGRPDPRVLIENFTRFYDRGMIVESLAKVLPTNPALTATLCDAALGASGLERECAIRVLAKGQKQSPRLPLLKEDQLSSLVPLLRDRELSDEAFLSLAEISAERSSSSEVLPALIQGFRRFHRFESAETEIPRWRTPRGSQCLEHALTAIKRSPTAVVLGSVSEGLSSEDPRVFIGTTVLLREVSERTIPERERLLQGVFSLSERGLVDKIKDPSTSVRIQAAAINSLGDFGMRASTHLPLLKEMSENDNAQVQGASFRSIGKIGGAASDVIEFYVRAFANVIGDANKYDSSHNRLRGRRVLVESLLEGIAACLPENTAVHLMKIALLNTSPHVAEAALNVLKKAQMTWRTAEQLFEAVWDPSRLEDSTLHPSAESNIHYLINHAGIKFGRDALPSLYQLQYRLKERVHNVPQFELEWNRYNQARIATENSIRTASLISS